MKFIRQILDMSTLMQLPKKERRIIFYSEGKAYWPHLESVLQAFLKCSDIPVCYVSSGADDPGLAEQHPRLRQFRLDEGWIRNWFFSNVETDVMVMTMPDLQRYQVKRSKYPVHYVYIHHALVSCHMVYRKGAFDHYDTILCAGPHHLEEIRRTEAEYKLPPKRLVEYGYGRLDAILAERNNNPTRSEPNHVLIAPSWGPRGLIETVGDQVVSHLLAHEYRVTLRPHPQTVKHANNTLMQIYRQYKHNPLFSLETNVASQASLHQSTIMISDWSGAALDYAFGLEKPVLFIDVPRKVNNPDYTALGITPFEVFIRDKIGAIVPIDKINQLEKYLSSLVTQSHWQTRLEELRHAHTFNVGASGKIGAQTLMELLQ